MGGERGLEQVAAIVEEITNVRSINAPTLPEVVLNSYTVHDSPEDLQRCIRGGVNDTRRDIRCPLRAEGP
jgi:hypothetical protein